MALDDVVGQVPGGAGELGGEDQPHRDRGAVAPLVALVVLDRVAEGVPVVEHLPAAGLAQVAGDDLGLDPDAALHELADHLGLRVAHRLRVGLDELEDPLVGDEAALDDLRHAGEQLVLGQRPQRVEVAQHGRGRVEGAHEVLALGRVDPGLAAHGGVDHAEQGGGHVHHAHAAQPRGGHEPREVGDRSPAHGHDRVRAGEVVLPEDLPAEGRHLDVLALLGVGDLGGERLVALAAQLLHDHVAGAAQRPRVDDEHALDPVAEHAGDLAEQPVADEDVVVLGRALPGDGDGRDGAGSGLAHAWASWVLSVVPPALRAERRRVSSASRSAPISATGRLPRPSRVMSASSS